MSKAANLGDIGGAKGVVIFKKDNWKLHTEISAVEKQLNDLLPESEYYNKQVDEWHDRGFEEADESYGHMLMWKRTGYLKCYRRRFLDGSKLL